ncbi:MAG: hypothetical protein AM326_12245 [Candidatus Thorarchaeota archaeon SMTZ-45]|nr:MAG: hypothetical protein AM326_12245 [Candidatus Thorarchaeota archaeon SMTZ-45]KXH74018.1 MAG: hypothetical protein AM325_13325 [Candidatus Thorarchaeota archaeon SMTZ1-45]
MDDYSETSEPKKPLAIRAYGISGSTLKKEIESITGINPGSNAVYSPETGRVSVTSEVFGDGCGGGGDCYCNGGGAGGGEEGVVICLIIIVAVMIALTIVWAIVMLAFSIMTIGGFFRKRFRTLVVIENENKEFIGKLAAISAQKHGVLQYPLGHQEYDEWVDDTFRLFNRLKHIRQISIFVGFWWAFFEVAFKLNQILLDPADYNLWPLRYVMITIFLPLLLYSPILEIQFRRAFNSGDEMIMRLVNQEPSYSPNQPMMFSETPIEVGRISASGAKKD